MLSACVCESLKIQQKKEKATLGKNEKDFKDWTNCLFCYCPYFKIIDLNNSGDGPITRYVY